ncbi:atlastin-3-like [Clavelina lepadiformis]|uniref:atlastin-3-like n=1 Tax=Clavelina lepadiformis TaxID=159417 RepID=UPI0040424729
MDYIRNAVQTVSKLLTAVGGTASPGKAIQVLIPKEDGSYDMNKVALKNLAEHPDVIHNPVAVISIAGAMREGKSFMLSLLTLYLESNLDCCWLDKPDTPIPYNFKWKGGMHRETEGVWIWSKPYLVQKKNGTKIALLLMDTQGCFDKSGARNDSNIFTFSTLLSSVQIYNLNKQIKENHLQPLAVFIDYAKESMKTMQSIQCFQTLLFLIRDWKFEDDFSYGKEGGDKYLEQEVFHYKGNDPDIIMVRDQIKKAFTSTNCILLPYPGKVIDKGKPKKPGTSIRVKDMDNEFREEIHHFFCFLIDDFTIPLKVGQKDIVGEELLNFTSKLFDLLQTNDIENPASAMEGISMAKGQTLMQRILQEYDTTLEPVIKSKCEASVLTRKHEEARQKALQDYDKDSAALHKNHKEPYKERLEKEIKHIFQKHLGTWKANQAKTFTGYQCKCKLITVQHRKTIQNSKEVFLDISGALSTNINSIFFHRPPFLCNFYFKFLQKCVYLPYCGYCLVTF